jgi:hypothetical protein
LLEGTKIVLLEDFYITMPELPSHEEVMQHASSNAQPTAEPVWARVCTLAGGALLVAVGVAFTAMGAWMEFTS